MVQSLNSKVDLVADSTSYLGLPTYGKVMVGNHGFEFYNDKNVTDYIQIPWEDVDIVIVSVILRGKWIPRYALRTKRAGTYTFSSKDPKRVLRAVREYIPAERIVRSLGFFDVLKRAMGYVRHK